MNTYETFDNLTFEIKCDKTVKITMNETFFRNQIEFKIP